ncbi:hypothetical protein ABPG77_003148 [Micractinium sp. CCAP 211/92]
MSAAQQGGPRAPTPAGGAVNVKAVRAQLELVDQDCTRISAPDYTKHFQNVEDAVDRLLPFHIFGAEDPQQTDMRDVASQQGQGASLATSRAEAWADFIMHKVDEYGAGLAMLEKRIHKAEVEALQRNKLPLLMLHSYAAAEAKQLGMPMQPQMAGTSQGQQAVRSAGVPPGTGPPVAAAAALQQAGGGKPMSAADAKAKQLAALAARINQRK